MEQWLQIRQRVLREGVSQRQILREAGMHRTTLEKILQHSRPPGYLRSKPPHKHHRPVAWKDASLGSPYNPATTLRWPLIEPVCQERRRNRRTGFSPLTRRGSNGVCMFLRNWSPRCARRLPTGGGWSDCWRRAVRAWCMPIDVSGRARERRGKAWMKVGHCEGCLKKAASD